MTTFAGFVADLATMAVSGVVRAYEHPPASLANADLPAMWPQLPGGDEQVLVHGDANGGDMTLTCQLVVALAPAGLGTMEQNFDATVDMLDSLTTALRANTDAAEGALTWTLTTGSVTVSGNDYWSVLAIVREVLGVTPFLSIVTRHMTSRPKMFAAHQDSLDIQTCQDFEHVVILDDVGRGVEWANAQFAAHRDRVSGEYVLLLDDDDALAGPEVVDALRRAATESDADVIVFRADHGPLGILPDAWVWGRVPQKGHIGGIDFIVKRELWQQEIGAFARKECGDFAFLQALWRRRPLVYWLPLLLTKVQRISWGQPE